MRSYIGPKICHSHQCHFKRPLITLPNLSLGEREAARDVREGPPAAGGEGVRDEGRGHVRRPQLRGDPLRRLGQEYRQSGRAAMILQF